MDKRDITGNINFFMNVPVTPEGGLTFEDGISEPGKYVEMRAEMDVLADHQQLPAAQQSLQRLQPDAGPGPDLAAAGRADVSQSPHRQSRRHRLPHHPHAATHGRRLGGRLLRGRPPLAARARRPTKPSASVRPPAAQSYLSVRRASSTPPRATGAEAIHPGYGFLSENAAFAEACAAARHRLHRSHARADARLRPEAHRARHRRECGVPLLPGTGLLADRGRGRCSRPTASAIRSCSRAPPAAAASACACAATRRNCASAFEAVERLSRANFGDRGVYLEKFVARARHIEVQIFGDGEGSVIALGERDCSAQRRNQKVIEETPAPGSDGRDARRAAAMPPCGWAAPCSIAPPAPSSSSTTTTPATSTSSKSTPACRWSTASPKRSPASTSWSG